MLLSSATPPVKMGYRKVRRLSCNPKFKIIIPLCVLVLWMITCYPVCNKADGFDYFLYWILVGCPYGIRKMCLFLVPKNFGIAGSMGILALNCIVGGLIGGIIVVGVRIIVIFTEIIKVIAGHNVQRCKRKKGNKKGIVNQS